MVPRLGATGHDAREGRGRAEGERQREHEAAAEVEVDRDRRSAVAKPHRTDPRKADLRARLLATRRGLGASARARASHRIRAHLAGLAEVARAEVVLGYAATDAEVDLDPLLTDLLARGATVALPVVEGSRLRLAAVTDLDADLVAGHLGVREPRADCATIDPTAVAVALVPGVGFDREGGRLGYGGGHFDRLLAPMEATTLGVAFHAQLVQQIPRRPHDVAVDRVVTEEGVIHPS